MMFVEDLTGRRTRRFGIVLTFADRMLGWRLGLGDLKDSPVCFGYVNACVCDECTARDELKPSEPVSQPWEVETS